MQLFSLSKLVRLLPLALLAFAMNGQAAGPALVTASVSPAGVSVLASVPVAASGAVLWATLTDYNRLHQFIPNMRLSRLVSAPGQPKVVEQRSDAGLFAFVVPEHVVLALDEKPNSSIRFRAIAGAVNSLNGEWQINERGAASLLAYRVLLVPLLPVPMTLPSGLVEREVRMHMEAVAVEAERRMRAEGKR